MWQVLVVVAALWLTPTSLARADATELQLDGISFSAEHGPLRLVDGSGRGTFDDPYVVVEDIHGDGTAVLTFRNVERRFGEPVRFGYGMGFALVKVVTNRTARTWTSFEMELREWLELESGYFDGLSFGQILRDREGLFGSDRFAAVEVIDEPTDRLLFYHGEVRPGETATFRLVVTNVSPRPTSYLLQRGDAPFAQNER